MNFRGGNAPRHRRRSTMVRELTDRQFRALNREMVEMVGQMEEYCRSMNAPLVIRKADGRLYELTVVEKMLTVSDEETGATKEVHAFLVTAEKALPAEMEDSGNFSLLDFSGAADASGSGSAAPAEASGASGDSDGEDLFSGIAPMDLVESYLYRSEHA